MHISAQTAHLQIYPHLLGVCHRGIAEARPHKGTVSYRKKTSQMPSLGGKRLWSGAIRDPQLSLFYTKPPVNHILVLKLLGECIYLRFWHIHHIQHNETVYAEVEIRVYIKRQYSGIQLYIFLKQSRQAETAVAQGDFGGPNPPSPTKEQLAFYADCFL